MVTAQMLFFISRHTPGRVVPRAMRFLLFRILHPFCHWLQQRDDPRGGGATHDARDVEGLLALYAADATLESPLVPAILDDMQTGVLRGHTELRRFFEEGGRRRPNALVRWYRAGKYLCDGKTLIWEYPREAPDGDQVDITEVMDIADGKIQRHRIYWGWFGLAMLQRSREQKS